MGCPWTSSFGGLWAVSLLWREHPAALAAPRAIAFPFEGGMFDRQVRRPPFPKPCAVEKEFVKPRGPWMLLCWTEHAFGKLFLRRPRLITWWHLHRKRSCRSSGWVPARAAPRRAKEESQGRLESFERTGLDCGCFSRGSCSGRKTETKKQK